jgi:hypothetical protein
MVVNDIRGLFESLSEQKLSEVENKIRESLRNSEMIDEEFWLSLLKRLNFFYAKAKIDEMHVSMVEGRVAHLRELGKGREEGGRREEGEEFWLSLLKRLNFFMQKQK